VTNAKILYQVEGESEIPLTLAIESQPGMTPPIVYRLTTYPSRPVRFSPIEAEAIARAIFDELGLDHLAKSLDLDRVLRDHAPTPEPTGGIADLTGLMAMLPKLPAMPNPAEINAGHDKRNAEQIEESWLMRVMDTAGHLYTARVLARLGEPDLPSSKPIPDGVMTALYSADELELMQAAQRSGSGDEALWHQCVSDAFELRDLVRGRELTPERERFILAMNELGIFLGLIPVDEHTSSLRIKMKREIERVRDSFAVR
jgi:hypothetical protein